MQNAIVRAIAHRAIAIISWSLTWGLAIVILGLLVGAAAVVLPPLAAIGIVAVVALVLLWAMPDLRTVPDRSLRKMFFITVGVIYTVPAYYAFSFPGLPWISIRRLFLAAIVLLFAIALAGSSQVREKLSDSLRSSPGLATCAIGFFVMMALSILTSASWPQSLASFVDATLTWYVLFATCILLVRTRSDVHLLLRVLVACIILDGFTGLVEFLGQQPYYLRILPDGVVQALLENNPTMANVGAAGLRRGMYRSISIYNTPLAFGEFGAMMAPICAYFIVHPHSKYDRVLGSVGIVFSMLSIFCSGARGAYMGFLLAMPLFSLIWAMRINRFNPGSLVGGFLLTLGSMFTIAMIAMVTFWPRFHDMVLGGAETQGSDEARFVQWRMAWPHILDNPITGNGFGLAGHVVGYVTPGGIQTVDSYVISLLVDLGVPGFVFFAGMLMFAIWNGLKMYLIGRDKDAELGGAIACSLVAFGVYRSGLSQAENHTLFFLLIAICFAVAKMRGSSAPSKRLSPSYDINRLTATR